MGSAWWRINRIRRQLASTPPDDLAALLNAKHLRHPRNGESLRNASMHYNQSPDRLWLLISRAARLCLPPATCLPKAIVLRDMLQQRGLQSYIRIGIDRHAGFDNVSAHAWVELDEQVIGEKELVETRFAQMLSA